MKLATAALQYAILRYGAATTDEERAQIAMNFMENSAQIVLEEIENHECREEEK